MSDKEYIEGCFVDHFECCASEFEHKDSCSSSDGLAIYQKTTEDGGVYYDGFCWSCNQHFHPEEIAKSSLAEQLGIKDGKVVDKSKVKAKAKKPPMTKEEAVTFIRETGYSSGNYRGIQDKYSQFYGHLTKTDLDGNVIARFYPETVDGKVSGYKSRIHPKQFGYMNKGRTGINSDLSGEIKFKSGGRYVLLVGGEEDKAAAFEMLRENQISRGQEDFDPIAVVSPTTGETSAHKQIANRYEFLDSFDWIILGMDSDKYGKEAVEKIVKVLPEDKVKIATWSGKDPNKMLQEGRQAQFIRDFYGAKEYVDTGIKSSADAMLEVEDFLNSPKIPLPEFLHRMQENMRGGIKSTGAIVNIIGDTSIGKSLLGDQIMKYWFFHSPLVPTVVSLERTAGELMADLYSLHLKKNLVWFKDGMDAINYLHKPEVKTLCEQMVYTDEGKHRFYVLDERDGNIDTLKKTVDRAIKQYGSKLIIFDPLTDFLRALPLDQQDDFMMYQKRLKKEGIVFLNMLHTRKASTDKDGKQRKVTEYDALGSGTFVQSADINIVLNRDKMAEDSVERNTTIIDMPKCRGGVTGHACDVYYDHITRQQYDLIDWETGHVVDIDVDDTIVNTPEEPLQEKETNAPDF